MVIFTWELKKAEGNTQRHGVDFHEAATALEDPLSTMFPDSECSTSEQGFITVRMSARTRLLVVARTERENKIRINGARRETPREQRLYEEGR